ncbi:CLUMA_CG013070, isoform A [Clunio marinus]|uniref:CLUMA_CG013070, isoform A n=1 Tax=Clunio marinus TaxID=568069 RepID=A0A1J1IHC3_9DIPT|nr:CLUMA_CG013070, isoform A [Clunio marinus]
MRKFSSLPKLVALFGKQSQLKIHLINVECHDSNKLQRPPQPTDLDIHTLYDTFYDTMKPLVDKLAAYDVDKIQI